MAVYINPTDVLRAEVILLVKKRIGLALDDTSPLSYAIEDIALETQEEMQNYMNRNDIPEGLRYTWVRLIVGVISSEYKNDDLIAELNPAAVTSVKEGDTQISFGGSTSANTSAVISAAVRSLTSQLNRFRKMGNI